MKGSEFAPSVWKGAAVEIVQEGMRGVAYMEVCYSDEWGFPEAVFFTVFFFFLIRFSSVLLWVSSI